jgi:colanic acid/amylovoran biosynthesis glycosyltransferase
MERTRRSRPVVLHVHHAFFERTETFIYATVTRHQRFHPVLVAWRFRNLDQFPWPAEDRHLLGSPRFTPRWVVDGAARRLTGRELNGERVARASEARVIHAHFGPGGVLALPLARALGLPLVTTFYGNDVSQLGRREAWRSRFRTLFAVGDAFLVEGPFMRERLVELGCPAEKVSIQPIGLALESFAGRHARPRGPEAPARLYFSARFVEKKGLLTALDAIGRLRRRRSDFVLTVAGDGPDRVPAEALVRSEGIDAHVRFLGVLTYDEHLRMLAESDIFVQPSQTAGDGDSEGGAPTTLLEAQAMCIPVVATTHADIPNVVVPGESAVLVPERDPEALAHALDQLLQSPESWRRRGEAGRRFVTAHHDLAALIPRLEGFYEGLLEASGAPEREPAGNGGERP